MEISAPFWKFKNSGSVSGGSATYSYKLQFPIQQHRMITLHMQLHFKKLFSIREWCKDKLFASATGDTSSWSSYCTDYSHGYCQDNQATCEECLEYCCGTWIGGGSTDYNADSTVYVDDIYVRKYASPEPSVLSVGSEQTTNTSTTNSAGVFAFTYAPNASVTTITSINFSSMQLIQTE